jgi:FKBP-type peptidyl-prolyl cis-trans isomerase
MLSVRARMNTSILALAVSVIGIAACSCGDEPKHASTETATAGGDGDGARSSTTASANATPITIDKGDGCTVVIHREGLGRHARVGDSVYVDYTAHVSGVDKPFASTSDWTERCRVVLGAEGGARVVPGLARGLEGLKPGASATITVPPELAYGKQGLPSSDIPPDATLVFDVEVSGVR